jgi:plastocyanin
MKRSSVGLAAVVASALFALAATAQAGEIKGKVTVQGIKSAENIVVYVDEIPGKKFDAPKEHALINQIKMKFEPHILVVQQGTTVDFLNSDSVGHNVYWPSVSRNRKLAHNMGTWPKGQKKSFEFNDVGAAPLLCNVHPEMSGYVVVVPTPYFGVTDSDGAFEIKDVPAGKYTLTTWSEDGKPTTQAVEVGAGTATIELTVKK